MTDLKAKEGRLQPTVAAAVVAAMLSASAAFGEPLLQLRLRSDDTECLATWRRSFAAVTAYPGCCDEIWFSTGIGAPTLARHDERIVVLKQAIAENSRDQVLAVLKTLHEVTGLETGYRPGGSQYYDRNPNEQVYKSLDGRLAGIASREGFVARRPRRCRGLRHDSAFRRVERLLPCRRHEDRM